MTPAEQIKEERMYIGIANYKFMLFFFLLDFFNK